MPLQADNTFDLLKCPFCGRLPMQKPLGIKVAIGCPDAFAKPHNQRWTCHAHPFVLAKTPVEALTLWNTRK